MLRRTPISLIRSVTDINITFKIETPATMSDTAPIPIRKMVIESTAAKTSFKIPRVSMTVTTFSRRFIFCSIASLTASRSLTSRTFTMTWSYVSLS
ncbi:hypothetical protein DSECCO2_576410 [anaerobic digester metagenome]